MIRVSVNGSEGPTEFAIDASRYRFQPVRDNPANTVADPEGRRSGMFVILEPFDEVWAKIQRAQSGAGDE